MSTSRKRNKASKGKKSNSSSSSRSLAGDGVGRSNQTDMAGLQEPGGGDASGAGAGGDPGVWEKKKAAGVAKAKAPAGDRLVYFDPQIILPPADKRSAPGGETAEEQRRYNNRWMFTPATVLSAVDPEPGVVLIRTRDSAVHRANGAELETVNPQALEGVPDAMNVSNLTQASLLHTVRERYNRDEVYTRVGPVLMSVNPYKWIVGLYAEDAMLSYHGKAAMVEAGELAPHLFGVADHAYSELVKGHLEAESETKEDVRARKARASNQSIIISGESGSGKTEATKIIMQYLARITSGEAVGTSDAGEASDACRDSRAASEAIMLHVGDLESRVLSCNPLLESFGNAVTLKNDNSSRFGKFIKIQFDKKGRIRGAQIQNYLLEKTRIVAQAKRERSYHIFYQLLAGSSGTLKKELKLDKGVAGFQCLKGSSIKGEDAPDFHRTTECLKKIGVAPVSKDGEHGQDAIFRLIAAIMHLLNVGFESVHVNEGEACEIRDSTRPSLAFAAELLGVEADRLEKAAVSKTMAVRSSNTMMLQTVEQAHDKVAALGKALYSQLFLWLVAKLNTTISAPQSDVWGFIGVLDIYGFEKFNTNSLEQLLINYANEHLQRHFNQHMFEVEQVDYDNEQIDWSYITFNDNKACLELIDGKGGLFSCLDDIQRFEGKEANLKFLSSFKQKHGPPAGGGGGGANLRGNMAKSGSTYGSISSPATRRNALGHPHFVSPRFDPDISFGIKHYAGDVFYNVAKFNQKNRENLTADMKELMASSTCALVVDVFKAGEQDGQNDDADDDDDDAFEAPTRGRGGAGGRTIRSKSIGIQFKESLAELMATIAITHPRYIRCVKPNPDKQSGRFDGEDVLLQLQYSGTMETIRIRQQGYALRELKDDFLKKYKVLQPDAEDLEALVGYLSSMLGASHRDWQIGTSKVFLRTSMSDKLNLMVDLRKKCATRVIQRWAVNTRRRRVVRNTLQPFLKSSVKVMKYLRAAAYFRNLLEERRAATSMARWYRLSRDRKRFVSMRDAEKVVKSALRVRYFVTQLGVRKEFAGSSVSEIEAAIETLVEKEKALRDKKDFLACLPVASRLHHLRIVATSMKERDERRKELAAGGNGGGAIGADGGPARQEVEVRLMEAGWRMADAEAEQNYAVCTRLQREIKNLEAQREQNPTLAELKEKEEKTKAEIDDAAANTDYAKAGQLQTELVSMEEKIKVIEEVVEAEKARSALKDLSQKELEDKIHTTSDELEAAKAAKEFAKCIDLQARLSEMQAAAEALPTMEQVEREVILAEAEMAAAKARKDYRRAAELSIKLPAILDRHSAVASAIRKAMNRKQLAEEVQRLEGEMRLAKAEKRFSQCSLLQRSLTEMQVLTDGLPSVREIEEEISDVRVKMDTAVSEKNYADAEKFRVRLTELAEEKALASEKEQHSNSSPQDPVAKARARLSASSRDLNFNSERAGLGAAAAGGTVKDYRNSGSISPLAPAPPADPSSGERSFTSPKAVKVKQAPAILSPVRATPVTGRVATARQVPASVAKTGDDVSVSKLRPKPAVTVPEGMSVTEVCKVMANARNDAALLTGAGGGMTGIITAIDCIRRVVAVSVDPNSTAASEVMTPNPTTVLSEDSAMEALSIMLGRHFRHLPVRNPRGDVTGILDIAKCLYDAVSRLQRAAKRKSVDSGEADEAEMSMLAELGKGKGKKSKAAMQALLAKMFADDPEGGTGVALSLAELLKLKGEPQLVFADDSARGAGKAIARGRKAVLVVDNGGLAGIFTEKDMLNRVLSKGINPDEISVEDVMTPNPDTVSSTMTVLEALQEMHENKYLHLPVVDEDSGNVLGVVSVMEIIQATAGEEGSTGWQALFGSGLDATGDGFSDTSSQASMGSIGTRASARVGVGRGKTSPRVAMTPSAASSVRGKEPPKKTDSRPVSMLKPKPPLCLPSTISVLEVAKKMADVRTDAAILLDNKGHLEGIISDQDVARRVVANRLDPSSTTVSEVMTPHPTIVHMADSAMECLGIMIEKRFRHLPVIDGEGNVTGLLSIAKCLYDAIQRLKKKAARAESSGGGGGGGNADLAASVLQMANAGKGKGKNKTRDLQAALAMLLANSPDEAEANQSLREILAEQTTSSVDGRDSITAAAAAIAKGRKAVLVLDQGRLAGILTPKDVLMRVVAKELDPDRTPVSSIMTPNPDTVPPEMTAVEALGEMHENKYLHLPVVDLDVGTVVGVVNVMEILRATAGDKGSSSWEAFFGSAMDAGDDVSDSASMYSMDRSVMSARQRGGPGVSRAAAAGSVAAAESVKHEDHHRPVSSLKPKPPLCLSVDLTVAQVAKRMAEIRTDAAILLGQMGDMKGVLTDHDVARKVVGRSLDPSRTPVSSVMTPDPIWVTTTDNAMDALETMLETHSRHLPVVSEEGAVSGMLNIAKCLYDAIRRLEKRALRAEEEGGGGLSGEKQELAASLIKMHSMKAGKKNGKDTLAAMTMLLQGLSDGEEDPTLEDILSEQTGEFAEEGDSVAACGKAISRSKKAVLVLRNGRLAGIVTPKDLLMRVVAKGLDPDATPVSAVMTPNPDAVPPAMTVIEALREMHENKYLHLPVVNEDSGKVLGVVSVMEIIHATAGDKGSDRWEAFFGDAMDAADDVSDSASMFSAEEKMSMRSANPGAKTGAPAPPRSNKKVSCLKPKRPVVMSSDGSVLEVATEMSLKRTDAALLTKRGRVVGIVTDHDFTRRVIAFDMPPDRTPVRDIMTAEPAMVSMDENAMEALGLMIQNKTRHLPVMDAQGKIGGLLDIAKCLYDAVSRLEHAAKKKALEEGDGEGEVGSGSTVMIGAVMEAAKAMKGKASAKNQQALQELMMLAMMGSETEREGTNQTLADVLASKDKPEFVRPRHTVREAASVIASQKKAVLVVEEGELAGIFTPKDMMNRVITKKLNPGTTAVFSVMTPNPDGADPSMTVVEALQQMCENRYLHLPVVDERSGAVLGVVDVMEIVQATVGQEGSSGWEAFFGSAMDAADDMSDTMSETSLISKRSMHSTMRRASGTPRGPGMGGAPPSTSGKRPGSMRGGGSARGGGDDAMSDASRDMGGLLEGWDEKFVYKVNDDEGNLYKFKASAERLDRVLQAVSEKLRMPKDAILLKYQDDDGDDIVLSGDDSLLEAVDMARASSKLALVLVATLKLHTLDEHDDEHAEGSAAAAMSRALGAHSSTTAIGIAAVAVVSVVAIFMSRGRK